MDIFEQGSREDVRFPSNKGELVMNQLWDLPLTSKTGFDLENVAQAVNRELKATAEESFVTPKNNSKTRLLELRLAIVKHIIASKQDDIKRVEQAQLRKAEKEMLLELRDKKKAEKLSALTEEEIENRLASLG